MERPGKGYTISKVNQAHEKYFEHEQPLHLMYMKNYRVYKCDENCDRDKCINYHNDQNYRRRPYMSIDGNWNYTPKMCKNPQPCKMADKCRFSHTKEECSYHPLVYKVNECKFSSLEKGKCSKWGFHCSFAHTEEDRRVKGFQQKNPTSFLCESFKTEPCENTHCKLEECLNYHTPLERRRNPIKYSYSVNPCNFVYKDEVFSSPENCPNLDSCELAHTKNEVYYHSGMYKTKDCKANPCYLRFCAFKHPGESIQKSLEEVKATIVEETKCNEPENLQKKNIEDMNDAMQHYFDTIEATEFKNDKDVSVIENSLLKDQEIKDEKSTKESIPNKLACKHCKQREIKWVFECGTICCGKCIGKICSLCNKKHLTRIDI